MLQKGMKGYSELVVTPELLASRAGSGLVDVFSTPSMIAGIEGTAAASVAGELTEGQTTVGANINVAHIAATPLGMKVRFETELVDIAPNGKILTFAVAAFDEKDQIGKGTHVRAIIDRAKFEARVAAKAGK